MSYFMYHGGFRMTSKKFHNLFGNLPRKQESKYPNFIKMLQLQYKSFGGNSNFVSKKS